MISQVAAADSSKVFLPGGRVRRIPHEQIQLVPSEVLSSEENCSYFTSPVPADYLEIVQDSNGFQLKDRKDESHEI